MISAVPDLRSLSAITLVCELTLGVECSDRKVGVHPVSLDSSDLFLSIDVASSCRSLRIPTTKPMIGTIRTKVSSGGVESPSTSDSLSRSNSENSELDIDYRDFCHG